MPGATATLWDDYGQSGQARQSAALRDVSREMHGAPSSVQTTANDSSHKSGFPTNAAASPIDRALMNKAAIIVVVAAAILVLEGAVAFRGHIL